MTNPCRLPDGYVLHPHDRLASTNDEALRLAEAGAPAGTVVWAGEQTRGRGRHGRTWASPPGNLYASVLLRPDCPMAVAAQLSLVAGLALGEALAGLGPANLDLQLKWPNDVLINGAKTAGILIEGASDTAGRAAWVIVGSGVNLISSPQRTPYPATCLAHEGFVAPTPQAVLEAYLAKLDHWLGRWRQAGFGAVRQAWLARGFGLGGEIHLRLDRDQLKGRFLDLTETGSLLLEQAGGRRREIAAGEVFYQGRYAMAGSLLLAIDVGNTNTVFALYRDRMALGQWRISTVRERTADEYAAALTQLMALKGFRHDDIGAAAICSVVPQALTPLRSMCQEFFGCAAKVVGENLGVTIPVVIENPREVGADRLVNAVAAHARYGGPLIVVDFGTATTFDVIDGEGRYCGGVIATGINLSLEALHRAAAKLPRVAVERPPQVIGSSTVSAMQSGVYWGYVSMIEGMVARIRDEFGEPMKVIATGGLAGLFADATDAIEQVDRDLTMAGLVELYYANRVQETN